VRRFAKAEAEPLVAPNPDAAKLDRKKLENKSIWR